MIGVNDSGIMDFENLVGYFKTEIIPNLTAAKVRVRPVSIFYSVFLTENKFIAERASFLTDVILTSITWSCLNFVCRYGLRSKIFSRMLTDFCRVIDSFLRAVQHPAGMPAGQSNITDTAARRVGFRRTQEGL